jgi:large subunit ribosomal protein L6
MIEKSVDIPEDIEVVLEGRKIIVKGPKGEVSRDFSSPRFDDYITLEKEGNLIKITSENETRKMKAMVGTIAAHVKNMITGVKNGYKYVLKINYVHFPITVEVKDDKVIIKNFLGEKGQRIAKIVGDTKIEVKASDMIITGIDKESVGQTAANIEQVCKIKRKDIRVFQDGIFIYQKSLQNEE